MFDPSDLNTWCKYYDHKWIGGKNNIKYSQGVQEGILKCIFSIIGNNNNPHSVEFGHNRNDLYGTNTGYFKEIENWNCIYFDGKHKNEKLNLYKELLTPQNIVSIYDKYNINPKHYMGQ